MKIRFKHVTIDNFLSIGHAEVDLENRGYTLINGINNCIVDNASSNGAGKSSITNAIFFALTGETAQGVSKNLVNIHTAGGAAVELDIEVDDVDFKICRYRDHKKFGNNLQIFVNGVDKSGKGVRDSEKILSEYLPEITSSFLGSVIILGQGMPQRFADNTPAGRKEVLERLSRSDFMVEDIKTRLNNRKTLLTDALRTCDDKILVNTSQLTTYEKQLADTENRLANLGDPTELVLEINSIKTKQQQLLETISTLSEELRVKKDKLTELTLNQSQDSANYNKDIQKIRDQYLEEKSKYQQEVYRLEANTRSLEQEIARLKTISDICPTCGQKLPDVHKVDTTEKEHELLSLKETFADNKKKLEAVNIQEQEALSILKQSFEKQQLEVSNNLVSSKVDVTNVAKTLEQYEAEEKAQSIALSRLESMHEGYEQQKQDLLQSRKAVQDEINRLNSETLYINKERDETRSRLDVISKMLTITSRDFRGFLLTNVIDYLNKRCKSYCMDIFRTDRFDLSLDGNNLNISYDGKLYENLSGGEQRKLDIITQFSIADMLRQYSSFRCNFLVLDEVFDGIDVDGCGKIVDTITKRLTDIESIFVVTHRANLMIPADSTITVVKDENGVSSIQ